MVQKAKNIKMTVGVKRGYRVQYDLTSSFAEKKSIKTYYKYFTKKNDATNFIKQLKRKSFRN